MEECQRSGASRQSVLGRASAERETARGEPTMNPVRIGTCGWSYQDWLGVFYPKGTAAGEYLPYYAERYPVVEVDSTFYRLPSRKMVEGWRDKTPDGFGFSLKVPQVITHEKMLADCEKELARIIRNDDQFYIEDMNTLSRTWVDHQQIRDQTLLQGGDCIRLVGMRAMFRS
jgi:hypothetical protein